MAHKRRSFLLFLSTIAICAVLGGVYGPSVEVASAASDDDSIRASFKSFTKVYSLVEENFADPVLHGHGSEALGHVALDFFSGVFFLRTVGRDGC